MYITRCIDLASLKLFMYGYSITLVQKIAVGEGGVFTC